MKFPLKKEKKKVKNVELTAKKQQQGEKREAENKQVFMRIGMRHFPRITNNSLFFLTKSKYS